MTYLYVEYPYYKKYLMFVTITAVWYSLQTLIFSFSFCTTTTSCSITRICSLWRNLLWDCSSSHPTTSTSSIGSRCLDAIFLTSTSKWGLMSWLRRGNTYWKEKKWKSGSGSLLISRRHSWDVTDNHLRMMHLISLTVNCCYRTLLEDTLMILLRNLLLFRVQGLESEREEEWGLKDLFSSLMKRH